MEVMRTLCVEESRARFLIYSGAMAGEMIREALRAQTHGLSRTVPEAPDRGSPRLAQFPARPQRVKPGAWLRLPALARGFRSLESDRRQILSAGKAFKHCCI